MPNLSFPVFLSCKPNDLPITVFSLLCEQVGGSHSVPMRGTAGCHLCDVSWADLASHDYQGALFQTEWEGFPLVLILAAHSQRSRVGGGLHSQGPSGTVREYAVTSGLRGASFPGMEDGGLPLTIHGYQGQFSTHGLWLVCIESPGEPY